MTAHLRRLGHILEHAPNNLGHAGHGGHQAWPGAYSAVEAPEDRPAFPVSYNTAVHDDTPGHHGAQAQDGWGIPSKAPETSSFAVTTQLGLVDNLA